MNFFGKVGNFIVKNQVEVQWIAVAIAVALCLWLFIRFVRKTGEASKQKREALAKISNALEAINDNIGDWTKQGDLIYIDNSLKKDHEQEALEEAIENAKLDKRRVMINCGRDHNSKSSEEDIIKKTSKATDHEDEKSQMERSFAKFLSREDGTDKHGRTYTIDELEKQIKE